MFLAGRRRSQQGDGLARQQVDAVIIGAGAAGLAAGRDLCATGLTAVILEARDRIGGRVFTVYDHNAPLPVELGAEFVHGAAPETFAITGAAGISVSEIPNRHCWSRDGRFTHRTHLAEQLDDALLKLGRQLRGKAGDLTVSQALQRAKMSPELRQMLLNFVEGYNAADATKISLRSLAGADQEQQSGEDAQFRIFTGYDAIVHWLRAGLHPEWVDLRLNRAVSLVRWKRREVVAHCKLGTGGETETIRARSAIITVPSSVLQGKAIAFQPELQESSGPRTGWLRDKFLS